MTSPKPAPRARNALGEGLCWKELRRQLRLGHGRRSRSQSRRRSGQRLAKATARVEIEIETHPPRRRIVRRPALATIIRRTTHQNRRLKVAPRALPAVPPQATMLRPSRRLLALALLRRQPRNEAPPRRCGVLPGVAADAVEIETPGRSDRSVGAEGATTMTGEVARRRPRVRGHALKGGGEIVAVAVAAEAHPHLLLAATGATRAGTAKETGGPPRGSATTTAIAREAVVVAIVLLLGKSVAATAGAPRRIATRPGVGAAAAVAAPGI